MIETPYSEKNSVKIRDGRIRLPQGPGLGIEPDETLFGAPLATF